MRLDSVRFGTINKPFELYPIPTFNTLLTSCQRPVYIDIMLV